MQKFQKQVEDSPKMNLGNWKIPFKSHFLAILFLIALVTAALYLTGDNRRILEEHEHQQSMVACKNEQIPEKEEAPPKVEEKISQYSPIQGCDLFSGQWVFDNKSYPLYEEGRCSFMLKDYACEMYGRKDFKYRNWRWQPHDCDLPRFNGTALLEKIRGKKLVFVGDSLNKNQWTSMLCMIESSLAPFTSRGVTLNGNMFTFQAPEYNATIALYWSPLLVESNCDDPETHRVRDRIFRVTSIEKHARHWTDADILIFNSFMWWLEPNMKILWGPFGSPESIISLTKLELRYRRYEMALRTWSDWLEINVNRTKTKLFFMSLSPYHFHGETWESGHNCYNETEPYFNESYWGIATDRDMMNVAESTIRKLEERGLTMRYLNITRLSDYRKDAHPSIYRKFSEPPNSEQLKDPTSYSDCVHWCLPGVPDVWNQILYSYIIHT